MSGSAKRYVIIGNGIAGTMCAETLRRKDSDCDITLITDEPYPLYNRVALPRYLKRDVPEKTVRMRDLEQHEKLNIDLLLETRVVSVHDDEKTLVLHNGNELPFDKLLVATGGTPRPLPVSGAHADHVYHFQTLDDTKAIIERMKEAEHAVTIGGSYIAYELTEGFRKQGLEVTWLMRGDRFLRRVLDEAGGKLVDQIARRHGVDVRYHTEAEEIITRSGAVDAVSLSDGTVVDTDMVGVGIGLNMNTDFLAETGVEVNQGVVCNQYLQTDVPDIYAAGDVAEFYDVMAGKHNLMGTWNNAMAHGRLAAENMMGNDQPYVQVPSYSSTLFDSTISVMGITPEIRPDVESLTRVDETEENYRKLFFLNNRVVGAVLIGDMSGRRHILKAIRSKEEVTEDREALIGL